MMDFVNATNEKISNIISFQRIILLVGSRYPEALKNLDNFLDCLQSGYQCWVLADKQQIIAHGVISIAICESHLLTL